MNSDLKLIKHHYGEDMMHLCRRLFPTILEIEGLLYKVLSSNFNPSKDLYDDILNSHMVYEFQNYIICQAALKTKCFEDCHNKSPQELMNEAGYELYECHSEEDIDSFIKYFADGERLCTFGDDRLKDHHVFFAVKKDVDKIKREDFSNPAREDLYGTSVISIQFSRGDINTLRITNRYNDLVYNPDATFSNNLDNIIPGLTSAFEKKYNLHIYSNQRGFDMPHYIRSMDGKFYKYNFQKNGIYYCPNNIIIDKRLQVHKYDKEKYIIMDDYILDLTHKKMKLFDTNIKDSFLDGFQFIKSIRVYNEKDSNHKKVIINDDIILILNHNNQIIEYLNPYITRLDESFMNCRDESALEILNFPNVLEVEEDFFSGNKSLKEIYLDNVRRIDNNFMRNNKSLTKISIPNVEVIGNNFLPFNHNLLSIRMPNVKKIGDDFLLHNKDLNTIECDQLKSIGSRFLVDNNSLIHISFPNVEEIKKTFMLYNNSLKSIFLPKVKIIGDSFLYSNEVLEKIIIPQVRFIDDRFLRYNLNLEVINLPEVEHIGNQFLQYNNKIKKIYFFNLQSLGHNFMSSNFIMEDVFLPKVKNIGFNFLKNAWDIQSFHISPNCTMPDFLDEEQNPFILKKISN